MAGRQLAPHEWRARQSECSRAWRALTAEGRAPFELKAAHEQHLRDDAMMQPFKPSGCALPAEGGDQGSDPVAQLKRNALSKVSKHRLLNTYQNFKDLSGWDNLCGGLACADGALRLDKLDLESSEFDLRSKWAAFVEDSHNPLKFEASDKDNPYRVHHSVCHHSFGQCMKSPNLTLACKFVHSLAGLLNDGALVSQTSDGFGFFSSALAMGLSLHPFKAPFEAL